MSAEKRTEKKEKTGENILFWEKGLTLYVGYGMNDVDDVCQAGGQKNKTDRGAETISNPLEEMLDGRRGERGIRRSSGAGPMAPGLGRSRIYGGLSLLWSAIKKSRALFGVYCSCEKKRSLCACATGFFYCLRKLFYLCEHTSVKTQGAQL